MAQHTSTPAPLLSLGQLVLYFLKLGIIGFGGPAALVGYMRKIAAYRLALSPAAQ
jgi:chromate transporter